MGLVGTDRDDARDRPHPVVARVEYQDAFSEKTSAGGEAGTRKEIMGDNHTSDSRYESDSPPATELVQAMRRYIAWRRLVMVGIGVGLFSVVVSLLHVLWPEPGPITFWAAVISGLVGIVGLPLAVAMGSHARGQVQRAQAGLPAVSASEPMLYGLLKAGLVLGGLLLSVGLPGAGCCWLVQWVHAHNDKPAPAVTSMGITVGLTLAIAGAGLLAISLGFYVSMRRNEGRDGRHADGR